MLERISGTNADFSNSHRDLEKSESGDWVKHSLINVLKLIRPTVILDEAQVRYGSIWPQSYGALKAKRKLGKAIKATFTPNMTRGG